MKKLRLTVCIVIIVSLITIIFLNLNGVTYAVSQTENLITNQNISDPTSWHITSDGNTHGSMDWMKWLPATFILDPGNWHQPDPVYVDAFEGTEWSEAIYYINLRDYKSAIDKGDIRYEAFVDIGNNSAFPFPLVSTTNPFDSGEIRILLRHGSSLATVKQNFTEKIPGELSAFNNVQVKDPILKEDNIGVAVFRLTGKNLESSNWIITNSFAIIFRNPRFYLIDSVAPKVATITADKSGVIYATDEVITFTVTFDENVTVHDETVLLLRNSTISSNPTENMLYAQYVSGSGSDTITFSYTVESGKYSADTERLEIFDINVASYIKDIIGNNADMQRGKLIDPPLRVEVSSIPELKNITKKYLASGIVGGEIQFTKADFLDNFSDKNNNNLKSIALKSLPSNGDLKLNGTVITDPNATIDVADLDTLSFSFDTDWTGVTSFTCVAYDDDPYQSLASEIATVTLVSNTRPVVQDSVFTTDEDVDIAFTQSDFDGKYIDHENQSLEKIKITLLPSSQFGKLVLNGVEVALYDEITKNDLSNLIFEVAREKYGVTDFEWKGSDGHHYSENVAGVSITINSIADAPKLSDSLIVVDRKAGYTFNLKDITDLYSDADGDELRKFKIISLPSKGVLEYGGVPILAGKEVSIENIEKLKYIPSNVAMGNTAVIWSASDGNAYSPQATLEFYVNAVPEASNAIFVTDEDVDISFSQTDFDKIYSDSDADPLNKVIITALPVNGEVTLGGLSINIDSEALYSDLANLKFEPAQNFYGLTRFLLRLSDGNFWSNESEVEIRVNSVNDVATLNNFSKVFLDGDKVSITRKNIADNLTDVDGKPFSKIHVLSVPSKGKYKIANYIISNNDQLNVTGDFVLEYEKEGTMLNAEVLRYKVFDGTDYSSEGAIRVYVNNLPEISTFQVTMPEDQEHVFKVSDFANVYTDPNNNLFEKIKIITLPTNGVLEFDGVQLNSSKEMNLIDSDKLKYIPNLDFCGKDSFAWSAYDGYHYSNAKLVDITIVAANDRPVITAFTKGSLPNDDIVIYQKDFLSNYYDADEDILSRIRIVSLPATTVGKLVFNGSDVKVGDEMGGNLDKIVFTPVLDTENDTNFKWQAFDGFLWSEEKLITLDMFDDVDQINLAIEDLEIIYSPGDSVGRVTNDVTLKTEGLYGTMITWNSDADNLVSNSGVVTRPSYSEGNKTTKLTATLTKESLVETKEFTLTITKRGNPSGGTPSYGGHPEKEATKHIVYLALEQGEVNKEGQLVGIIEITEPNSKREYLQDFPTDYYKEEKKLIVIKTPIATVSLPDNMFTDVPKGKIELSITESPTDELPEEVRAQIGDKPVISVNILVDGEKTKWANDNAYVEIEIPYTPTDEELKDPNALNKIIAVYIDDDGNIIPLTFSSYDPERSAVVLRVNHFSYYGVQYVDKDFVDLGKYTWAEDAITTLAARGVINGVSKKEFAPQENITRADFVVLIARFLALDEEFIGNYSDVKEGAYYYNAVGVAKEMEIVTEPSPV